MNKKKQSGRSIAALSAGLLACNFAFAQTKVAEGRSFRLEEATIADVHRAFRTKQLTATQTG